MGLISWLGISDYVRLFLGTSDLIVPWCPGIVQSISTKDQMQVGSGKGTTSPTLEETSNEAAPPPPPDI
jgi:hypothetical protein